METGLVLSGGGARGVAQIGLIKALEEFDIEVTHISGSSAGAVIGAMYASGASVERMLDFFKSVPIFHFKRYARNKPGFIDTMKFYKDFLNFYKEDNFSILDKKLFVNTTNLGNGKIEIFENGELIRPLLASASIPGIFTPVAFNDGLYADGGITNNFPVKPLIPFCDHIIGGYVNPLKEIEPNGLKHSYQVITRAYQISLDHQCHANFKDCDLVIIPRELENHGLFSLKNIDKIFEIGYQESRKVLKNHTEKKRKLSNRKIFNLFGKWSNSN
ncbi:patatin-like phospholipase family protein [Christiangramia sabulilitoris]|uniref:Patatin-like phospholipase family protein n=1 Tax=Christiangramia sabulilitoris TaxID=2583991 RepID=A0A550I6L7_9FLAO|nr:patatin-like phospholipase family protein [Christiangramia sabulilitoris]TRO66624.1 patatin-like phospholipase family protein [Christiangramia sabulilitoris]